MGQRVRLLPSGQEFYVEGQETLLAAAIRIGVALPYGCSNGNCGLCKARILDGEVKRIQHQDYVFSAAQRRRQYVLMCANTPVTQLVIEAQVAEDAGDIAEQHFQVKVRKLEKVSDELLILHVRMPRGERMRFIAGQYATIGIPKAGKYDYSIASCPCDEKRLEFHIRFVEGEAVSEYIFNDLKPRAFIDLTGPKGQFVLQEDSLRPMIMIAFDTGFAAIKSLLEHATAQEKEREIHLYWIACGTEGQYLNNLCRAWQDALDEFHYTPLTISKGFEEALSQQDKVCEITRKALLNVVRDHPDLSGFDLYISAPQPVLESAQRVFLNHKLDTDRLKTETVHGNQNVSCLVNLPPQ
jgi:CDP-4-dehydro-6-deoxyglucose reductase